MVLTRSAKAAQGKQGPLADQPHPHEKALSIQCLPHELLLHILSYVRQPADLRAFLHAACVSKGLLRVAADPVLAASLLMKLQDQTFGMWKAASRGRGDVVLEMLKMGASATKSVYMSWYERGSPLQVAIRFDLPQVAQYLWQRQDVRADFKAAAYALHDAAAHEGCAEYLRLLLTSPSPLSSMSMCQGSSLSPLQEAAWFAHVENVQVLLSLGASCAYHDEYGESALHYACSQSNSELLYRRGLEDAERSHILGMLLNAPHGKIVMDSQNDRGYTPLAFAAMNKLPRCCENLLSAGSKALSVRNRVGKTPLQIARDRRSWHPPVLEVLMRYDADLKA